MKRVIPVLVILVSIVATGAWAQDPVALINKARSSCLEGDYAATLDNIRTAYETSWNLAPLAVKHAAFVTEPPEAYGMFSPRPEGPFESIDPIELYCEPVGYTIKKDGEWYTAALTADFVLADPDGKELGGQPNFYQWSVKSRNFNTEVMMFFTINLKGLAPGSYILRVTLNDQNSDKKATFEKSVAIQ